MPQGGGSTSASSNQETAGIAGKEIFKLVREGVSWSGHERNSCFLSSGTSGRFLNISEASGFAFPDDGRAMILTDWDGDGDLDSFISNRNAPQVRFLRNDIPQINKNWISHNPKVVVHRHRPVASAKATHQEMKCSFHLTNFSLTE